MLPLCYRLSISDHSCLVDRLHQNWWHLVDGHDAVDDEDEHDYERLYISSHALFAVTYTQQLLQLASE